MKRYYLAAGALLLGTSTFALAADTKPIEETGVEAVKVNTDTFVATETKTVEAGWDKTLVASKPELDASADAKVDLASVETSADAKVDLASVDTGVDKLATTETDAELQAASAESFDKADTTHSGMGGPLEADVATTASLTPQPAVQNYPPCDPGPGDDRCIQLYEEGVRDQLASWNGPSGGLASDSAKTAMGGPYEPVADSSGKTIETAQGGPYEPVANDADVAMNGDGAIDAAGGETAESEAAASGAVAQSEVAQHSDFTGVGGPVEAQSGYPPCSPGPGDDRCIQLYEAGVSGAGN